MDSDGSAPLSLHWNPSQRKAVTAQLQPANEKAQRDKITGGVLRDFKPCSFHPAAEARLKAAGLRSQGRSEAVRGGHVCVCTICSEVLSLLIPSLLLFQC